MSEQLSIEFLEKVATKFRQESGKNGHQTGTLSKCDNTAKKWPFSNSKRDKSNNVKTFFFLHPKWSMNGLHMVFFYP